MSFGLIFFASGEASSRSDKYHLVIESAKFADRQGFSSVWIPERHFTQDGCLFPNPAVLQAALARETKQIKLGAGSVVQPLHDPVRVAEEWAVVDNLSAGRVRLSFASGWHPDDFVFFPERYGDRHEEMYRGIETVRQLWRGETVARAGGDGKRVEIRTYPTPVQRELPIWITSAGNVETFVKAGEIGANLLTHMFNHSVEELAEKIRRYRESLAKHGFDPQAREVSLMLHTFIGAEPDTVREQARTSFCQYLRSASYLLNAIAYSRGKKIDLAKLSENDLKDYLDFVFERLLSEKRVLFGTPEDSLAFVGQLKTIGVNEIACQLDFGVDVDTVLQSLPHLNRLKELSGSEAFIAQAADRARLSVGDGSTALISSAGVGGSPDPNHAEPHTRARHEDLLGEIKARCQEEIAIADFYGRFDEHGINLGSSFRGIERLWRGDREALGRVALLESLEREATLYEIHPAFLDACCQVLTATLGGAAFLHSRGTLYVPVGLREFKIHSRPDKKVWSHAVLRSGIDDSPDAFEGDVRLLNEDGELLVEVSGMRLQQAGPPTQQARQGLLADLLYEMQWQPRAHEGAQTVGEVPPAGQPETWLIFADGKGAGEALASLLEAQGAVCVLIAPGEAFERVGENQFRVNAGRAEDLEEILVELFGTGRQSCRGVVHFWSLDNLSPAETTLESLEETRTLGCVSVLHLVQCMARMGWREPARLWLITQGAQAVIGTPAPVAVAQSTLWGLGRTLAQEHPNFWGGLIDLDPHTPAGEAATAVWREVRDSGGEDQIAFREQQRYVARFARARRPPESQSPIELRDDSSYLITGGTGGLGLLTARWMVERGARHLVILSRTRFPKRSDWDRVGNEGELASRVGAVKELEALGADVHLASVDVADERHMTSFFEAFRGEGRPPIRGVVHAAGVVKGSTLLKLDGDSLDAVLRPKVGGAWLLHRLLAEDFLDFFILFSAIPSMLGWLGQGAANYAAANAFLDALAHYRRARKQPALSINWGPWRQAGMVARTSGAQERLALQGIGSISPAQGMAILEHSIRQDLTQVAAVKFDWPQFFKASPSASASPVLSQLMRESRIHLSADAPPQQMNAQLHRQLISSGPALRQKLFEQYALEKVSQVLGTSVHRVDAQTPLVNIGLDSLMAIELKNRIDADLGVRVPMTAFLQGQSIADLAPQVFQQLTASPTSKPSDSDTAGAGGAAAAEDGSLGAGESITHSEAVELLANIDQISDAEVNSTLVSLLAEEGHETF
jgi:natural product biosynthesis luciferase-like monooxygenase protein